MKKKINYDKQGTLWGGIPGTSYLDSLTFFIWGGYSGNMKFEVPDIFLFGGGILVT